jgi:hypothetical protein
VCNLLLQHTEFTDIVMQTVELLAVVIASDQKLLH